MASPSTDAHRLIITEKPSVARDLARVLGNFRQRPGYLEGTIDDRPVRISWCLGHLVELAEPEEYRSEWKRWRQEHLPMLPDPFRLRPRSGRGADQWRRLSPLLVDPALADVVNACDAGREGELIFAYTYQLSGCTRPVSRLWISSMTDAAIRAGYANLRPGADFAPLEAAARCRSEADWLVGLNATRAMTLRNQRAGGSASLTVGRVQTPTLALVVDRERAIRDFVPRPFWKVELTLRSPRLDQTWKARWRPASREERDAKKRDEAERLETEEQAQAILERARAAGAGRVVSATRKERRDLPPLLYDLTTLQREANRRFNFSAQRTLQLAQSLYETHKLLTYPRTDSRHLTTDQVTPVGDVLRTLRFGPYVPFADTALAGYPPEPIPARVFDDSEVGDHHAIIPTTGDPQTRRLQPDEKRIYDLVARRLLGAFHDPVVFANTVIRTDVAGEAFVARGRTRLEIGWHAVDPPRSTKKDVLLPAVEAGDDAEVADGKVTRGETKPPPRYTEASLLGAMERAGESLDERELRRAMKECGLGTPATRAAVIEKLIAPPRSYIRRDGKHLAPTDRGEALIDALPDGADALRSARLTGEWEARLTRIADGREPRPAFIEGVRSLTRQLIDAIAATPASTGIAGERRPGDGPTGPPIAPCPRCQEPVAPERRGWVCGGCDLIIWKTVAGRELSARMAKALLTAGRTQVVKGFRSKAGKEFRAALVLGDDNRITFDFPESPELGACPACGTAVRERRKIYGCETGRECPFVVFKTMSEREIPVEAVEALLATGTSTWLEGFRNRQGKTYDGVLRWDPDARRVLIDHVDRRTCEGPAGPCPACGGEVAFRKKRWRCARCDFSLPGQVMERELRVGEVASLLTAGRTPRLHGFRQKGGAYCKAALALGPDHRIVVDFAKRDDEPPQPIPADGPSPAFGERIDCPLCLVTGCPEPGYVIAGNAAWGCSRWRDGCVLQVPFVTAGRPWAEDEIRRAFGKHRASRYLKGFLDDDGKARARTWRLVIDAEAERGWQLEERRTRTSR